MLTTVCRPPSSNASFMDDLENYFHILDEQDKELILTGDLNCDFPLPVLQSHSRRLMDILELFQMNQVITAATRITGNTDSSPSRRREAPCEGTNSPRLFTPGETKALAKSKVHQISRA